MTVCGPRHVARGSVRKEPPDKDCSQCLFGNAGEPGRGGRTDRPNSPSLLRQSCGTRYVANVVVDRTKSHSN